MNDCKYLTAKDVTPWHADVFDHPDYEYICKLTGKKIIPYIHCKSERCKKREDEK